MVIRTAALIGFTVTHAESAGIGPVSIPVTVNDIQAQPVGEAVVCLYQPGGIHYAYATNNNGIVNFEVNISSGEDIIVTVWKQGFVNYSGAIEVEE